MNDENAQLIPSITSSPTAQRKKRLVKMLQVFIALSLLLHVAAGLTWLLPAKIQAYRQQQRQEQARREAERKREEKKQAEEEARRQAMEQVVAVTKQEVTQQLKLNFQQILGEAVKPDAAEELWNQILSSMGGELDRYAEAAGDASASDQQVLADAQAMQAKMMEELYQRLRGQSARYLADKFVEQVQQQIAPKLADYYQKQIDQRIGIPLNNEGSKIAREEAQRVRTQRQAAQQALVKAEQSANQAVTELNAAQSRLAAQVKQAENPKADKGVLANAVKSEQAAVTKATAAVGNAQAALNEALTKGGDALSGPTRRGVQTALQGQARATTQQISSVAAAVGGGDAPAAATATTQAAASAKQLVGVIQSAKESAKAEEASDPMVDARQGLRIARDGQIKGELARAFADNFNQSTAPRLSTKLTKVFAKTLEDVGAGDKAVVEEVQSRVASALGEKVRDTVDAGQAGTARLSKAENLDSLPALPGDGNGGGAAGPGGRSGAAGTGSGAGTGGTAGAGGGQGAAGSQPAQGGDGTSGAGSAVAAKLADRAKELARTGMGNLDGPDDGGQPGDGGKGGTGQAKNGKGKPGQGSGDGDGDAGDGDGAGDGSGLRAHGRAVAGKVGSSAKSITEREMAAIGNDQAADNTADQVASGFGRGGRGGRGGAGGEGDGEAIDPDVLDRVGTLLEGVKSGRLSLLDGAGGGAGSGAGGGGAGNGPGGGPGKGLGPGGGGGIGGDSSFNRFAQMRRQALVRGQAAQQAIRYGNSRYREEDYEKLTAGIHQRDASAAKGQAIQRTAVSGQNPAAATAPPRDLPKAAMLIVPPAPKSEPVGQAKNAAPFKPTFQSIAFAAVPFRNGPVTIDGDLAEWKDIPALTLNPILAGDANAPNLRKAPQQGKMQWDNKALYFAYDVIDADDKITQASGGNFWIGDGVEIWLDPLNTKAKERTAQTMQFWGWALNASSDPKFVGGEAYVDERKSENIPLTADQIQVASKKSQQGWTMEVRIPIERLRATELVPGRIMGMNFSVCTGTAVYCYWAGKTNIATSVRPDTWGDVMLAGSDGRLECVEKLMSEMKATETSKPISSLRIGEPLKIRVTDMDMNLDDARKDKIAATVVNRHGGRLVAVLEETGEKTGLFEGSVPTALETGDPLPGVLSLYDGESVDVLYTDQARGNGARNVEVKLSLPTAAAVTGMAAKP